MARSISSEDEWGSRAMVSPVAGSKTGSTWTSPPRASTKRPPTKVPTVSTLTGATIARPAEHVDGPRPEGGHRRPAHHVGQGQATVNERVHGARDPASNRVRRPPLHD